MQIMACMILGNLARNDENCKIIIGTGVGGKLVEKLRQSDDARVIQLGLGALRNASLQIPQNKIHLKELGIYPLLVKFLTEGNHHTKFSAIGVIKSLITGPDPLISDFVSTESALTSLLSVANEDPTEGNERVQYEASRVLVIVLQRSERGREEILSQGNYGKPLGFLLKAPFDVLNVEGARGLLTLASSEGDLNKVLEKSEEFLPQLVALLDSKFEASVLASVEALKYLATNEKGREKIRSVNQVSEYFEKAKNSSSAKASQAFNQSKLIDVL